MLLSLTHAIDKRMSARERNDWGLIWGCVKTGRKTGYNLISMPTWNVLKNITTKELQSLINFLDDWLTSWLAWSMTLNICYVSYIRQLWKMISYLFKFYSSLWSLFYLQMRLLLLDVQDAKEQWNWDSFKCDSIFSSIPRLLKLSHSDFNVLINI